MEENERARDRLPCKCLRRAHAPHACRRACPCVSDDPDRDPDSQDLHQSLKIVGQSASLCEDDKTAAWLESQQHLQLWMGDKEEDLWIDRYDVRLLLSDASLFARSARTRQQLALYVPNARRAGHSARFGHE